MLLPVVVWWCIVESSLCLLVSSTVVSSRDKTRLAQHPQQFASIVFVVLWLNFNQNWTTSNWVSLNKLCPHLPVLRARLLVMCGVRRVLPYSLSFPGLAQVCFLERNRASLRDAIWKIASGSQTNSAAMDFVYMITCGAKSDCATILTLNFLFIAE